MQRFYLLSFAHLRGELVASPSSEFDDYKFVRGELSVETPVEFGVNLGRRPYDFIFGGLYGLLLYHNRFFEALEAGNITGFGRVPAVIKLKDGKVHDYSCLIIKGRCAGMDDLKGDVINKGSIVPGGAEVIVKKGIYFDENDWDGSDIFLFDKKLFVIVTERVKIIVDRLKITNIRCEDTLDFEIDIHTLAISRPELMQYYLDKLNNNKQ